MIDLEFVPHRTALLAGQDNTLDVVLRAKAPAAPRTQREPLPLNLAIVIDRSGSMSGRPLEEAKRCAAMIVDGLSLQDHASVVAYDSVVDVLVTSRPVDDKELFRRAIGAVESRGMTALHGGWLTGAEQAATKQNGQPLSRVLLLSDGCANQGITDAGSIARHCGEMADAGVGTSTYGLGQSFNEELMTAMARAGQGNAYYGQTAEDLMDPFREEFDLMSALCARGLRLALAPARDVRVQVLNQYRTDAEGRTMLPDLAYGGEAWAVLRLTVPRSVVETGGMADVHLLTASLAYADLDGRPCQARPVHLRLPRLPAAAFAAVTASELVAQRSAELRAAALQEEGRQAALRGDWIRVEELLGELRALAEGNAWLTASIAQLEAYARRRETQRFSKEAHYKAARMRSRLAASDEGAEWSVGLEEGKRSYLRRKLEQGKRLDDPARDNSGSAK
jgi:Ca-activated chloride channel family protein